MELAQVTKVLRAWAKRHRQCERGAQNCRKLSLRLGPKDSLIARRYIIDANRYEGIATGTRWAIEDLEKLIEKPKSAAKTAASPGTSRALRKSR